MSKNLKPILTTVLVVLILIAGAAYTTNGFEKTPEFLKSKNPEKTAEEVLEFINEQILQGAAEASLEEVTEEKGLYKIALNIEGQTMDSYVTKDGKLLFPEAIDLTPATSTEDQEESSTVKIPKSETPTVELFVMSFCPYGNQAELTMEPVYELLEDKVDWDIHYIVSEQDGEIDSLHGQPEVDQNARELCVLENYGVGKWFDFANYINEKYDEVQRIVQENCTKEDGTMDSECYDKEYEKFEDYSEEGVGKIEISFQKIENCTEEKGTEMQTQEAQISQEKGASGSPTLLINGVESEAVYDYGNPESYKQELCSAFETPPSECEEELSLLSDSTANGGSCN